MKKTLIKILSLTLLMGLILPSNQIKANEETNNLRNDFLEIGVAESKVDDLVEKVYNGEMIDSLNPDKEPITTITESLGDSIVTKQEYEDGSITQITVTPRENIIINGTVSGGNKTTGSYWMEWKKAEVKANSVLVNCYFHADFNAGNGSSTIKKVYTSPDDYGITVVGGTYSNVRLSIITANGSSSTGQKAEARLSFNVNGAANWGSSTAKLKLFVTGGGVATASLTN